MTTAGVRGNRLSCLVGRFLLNNVATVQLALLFSGGFAASAALGLKAIRVWSPQVSRGPFNNLATFILPMVVGVYGLVLGFVVVTLYDDYKAANDFVQAEAANLEDVYRYSARFPAPVEAAVGESVGQYVGLVVNREWQLLNEGTSSPEAASALGAVFAALDFEPTTQSEAIFLDQAVSAFHEVHLARHSRLDAAAESLPPSLGAFVFIGAVVVIALTYFFGEPNGRAQMTMVVSLGAVMGFTLMLVLILDHPFAGATAISPAHFGQGLLSEFFVQ